MIGLMSQIYANHEKDLVNAIRLAGDIGFVAGGAARKHASSWSYGPISDVDIFCKGRSVEEAQKNFNLIHNNLILNDYEPTADSPNAMAYQRIKYVQHTNEMGAYKLGIPIQVIKPFKNEWMQTYGSPVTVLDQFDFTVAKAAFLTEKDILVHKDFKKDDDAKRLVIKHINCPIAVTQRLMKYHKKGYHASLVEVFKLFTEWETRGPAYRQNLRELVSRVDPNMNEQDIMELERLLRMD